MVKLGSRTARAWLLATTVMAAGAASPAFAQPVVSLGEVVVTARRTSENVQDIPVAVQALSGEALQKYSVTQVTEITKLAPGLQLNYAAGARGTNAEVTLRGVRWASGTVVAAIPIYLDEVVVDPNFALLSLYDVSQLEVLRGPQGMTRGAPSISGAITIAPRRANLGAFGGYGYVLAGSHDHRNLQAAVNIPIIRDKLAIRIAGLVENTQGNMVRSLNNPRDPQNDTRSGRVSVRFEPTYDLAFNLSYQHIENTNRTYDQLAGAGSPGFTVPSGGPGAAPRILPPNYNGPPLRARDYLALEDRPSDIKQHGDFWALNASWNLVSHTLSYIGAYQQTKTFGSNVSDPANALIGYDSIQRLVSAGETSIHELRLASNPSDRMFDYVVGGYVYHTVRGGDVRTVQNYLPGAFGAPGQTPSPFINPQAIERYFLPQFIQIPSRQVTSSIYGSVTLHLGASTELTGGVRSIHDHRVARTSITIGPGIAATAAGPGGACAGATVSAVYGAGVCDRIVADPPIVVPLSYDKTYTPTIYNVSLSHRFTPDILAYGTVGSSYRIGVPNTGINVVTESIRVTRPEKATSYEVGLKTTWLEQRLRLNGDVFQIDYKGQLTQFPGIAFRQTTGQISSTSNAFFANVDARVRGVEVEAAYEPAQNLTLGLNLSYAKITAKGGPVPCNNPAVPLTATNEMNFCPGAKGQTLNTSPKFTATLNGEYVAPMGRFDAYARFNIAYRGKNPNYGYLAGADAYTLVDLFAGARAHEGGWELGAYVKNLFDDKTELSRVALTGNLLPAGGSLETVFGPPGYAGVVTNLRREVGVSLRYAFGSR